MTADQPKQKILVIDDEKTIAELVKNKLEREGFEVSMALDGVEGFEAIVREKPDLIILDILMPRLDGFQFYKKIKSDEATSHIPILVMTGRGAMKDTFEELGVEAFLAKPFEPEELLFRVKKILSSRALGRLQKKALIAGCDREKLEAMQRQLKQKGYETELSVDGAQALGKALKSLPDLFVVQFDMPTMNAEEIIQILANHPQGKNIPVVVYSPLQERREIQDSKWGRFLRQDQKKEKHERERPIKIIDKFDSKSFLDKIKDIL